MKPWGTVNRVLLGLLMLVPGLMALFVFTPNGVAQNMSGIVLFSWAPVFWAWVLIISEIVFGIAILANYKVEYTTIPPIIILTIATLFVTIQWSSLGSTGWSNVIFHLLAISNYILLGCYGCKKKR